MKNDPEFLSDPEGSQESKKKKIEHTPTSSHTNKSYYSLV